MKKFIRFFSAAFFAVVLSCCSSVKPITQFEPTELPLSMGPKEQKDIIIRAGLDQGWKMFPVAPNQIVASYESFPKRAVVNIYLQKGQYHITYRDSQGLLYDGSRISPTYNIWTAKLKKRIDEYFNQAAEK